MRYFLEKPVPFDFFAASDYIEGFRQPHGNLDQWGVVKPNFNYTT